MLDLIMLGLPWFAGAGALGGLTGYLTSSRDRNASVAPGWVFLALLLAHGASASAVAAGYLEGRAALTAEIALCLSLAYFVGLPLGRGLKLLGATKREAPPRATLARPVIVKTVAEPVLRQEPAQQMSEADPASAVASVEAPPLENVVIAAKALSDKAAEMRAPAKLDKRATGKKPVGQRPSMLAEPRSGGGDDLTRIKGLGPKSAEKLNALGIFHYDQIAGWTRDNARWIGAEIGVASRVERDDWVAQARKLAGLDEERAASAA